VVVLVRAPLPLRLLVAGGGGGGAPKSMPHAPCSLMIGARAGARPYMDVIHVEFLIRANDVGTLSFCFANKTLS
jgi:hypothetical protein